MTLRGGVAVNGSVIRLHFYSYDTHSSKPLFYPLFHPTCFYFSIFVYIFIYSYLLLFVLFCFTCVKSSCTTIRNLIYKLCYTYTIILSLCSKRRLAHMQIYLERNICRNRSHNYKVQTSISTIHIFKILSRSLNQFRSNTL